MAISLKHIFQSAKADGVDNALIQPSNWNDEHTLTVSTNKIIGRSTAGTGDAEEIAIGTALLLSGGTLSVSTVPVANGGTGANTLAANNVLLGNGTSAVQTVAPSTIGNVLTSNGTTWVSQAPPGGSTVALTASGSISAGAPVVQNADGTVSSVTGTYSATPALGGILTNNTNATNIGTYGAGYDPNLNKYVFVYRDQGTIGNPVNMAVGTPVGNGITFDGPTNATTLPFGAATSAIVYDPNSQRFAIFYVNGSNYGAARVFAISGSGVVFYGSEVVFHSAAVSSIDAVYDPVTKQIVVAFSGATASTGIRSIVATTSSANITFGAATTITTTSQPGSVQDVGITYDTANSKVIVGYANTANALAAAVVGTVSGTSISFGSPATFGTTAFSQVTIIRAVFDKTVNKPVLFYRAGGTPNSNMFAVLGTVSGTSISFGTAVDTAMYAYFASAVYDPLRNIFVLLSNAGSNNYVLGSVSGSTISMTSPIFISNTGTTYQVATAYATSQSTPLLFFYSSTISKVTGTTVIQNPVNTTNLTERGFVGFSTAAYTTGQTAVIAVTGAASSAQSGLVTGQPYYVQPDGSLGLYPNIVNVYAGRATSSTTLLVKG